MERAAETARAVEPLIEHVIAGEKEKVQETAKRVSVLEGETDDVKNEIRDHLPNSLFMPVNRGDLLAHLAAQDRIADTAEDLAVLFTLRHMDVPPWMEVPLREYVRASLDVVEHTAQIVKELDVLVEATFAGPEAARVLGMANEVGKMEHEADKLQDKLAKALFAHEDELAPVAVFMWAKILNKIGDLANNAETVANRIRLFTAK
jgi:predicted phosphate transport protein (TIGR00153 family)